MPVGQLIARASNSAICDFTKRSEQDSKLKIAFVHVPHRFSHPACNSAGSDVGHRAEELVIFGISAFAFVDGLDVFYKLNGLYPFHHFESEFIFRAQP